MDRISIRRGTAVPTASDLNENELGYRTGARALYIGTASAPVLLASADAAAGVYSSIRLTGGFSPEQVQNGTLFESADGGLYYKNRSGVTLALAEPPQEPEE